MIQTEYRRLVEVAEAEGDRRLVMLVQTICATGSTLPAGENSA